MKYENVYGPFNLPNGTSIIHLSDTEFHQQNLYPGSSCVARGGISSPSVTTSLVPVVLLCGLGYVASWPEGGFRDSVTHVTSLRKLRVEQGPTQGHPLHGTLFPLLGVASEIWESENRDLGVSVWENPLATASLPKRSQFSENSLGLGAWRCLD